MKKVKIFWPTVLALSVAVTLNSCQNERMKKEYEKRQLPTASNYELSQVIKPAEIDYDKYKLDEVISVEDYLKMMEEESEVKEEVQKTR